jgi:hypothetical protein
MRLFVGMLLAIALVGTARAQDCKLVQYDTIPMTITQERTMVPVSIGDTTRTMGLELGAANNTITSELATHLKLYVSSVDPSLTIFANNQRLTRIAHADIKFGMTPIPDTNFLIVPEVPAGTDGMIGMGMFRKIDFELDMAQSQLKLFSTEHCPQNVVYWTKTGFAEIPLKSQEMGYLRVELLLDGQPAIFALDTTGGSSVSMNVMRAKFGLDGSSPGMEKVSTGAQGFGLYRYAFKTLAADGLTVKSPAILVQDGPPRRPCDGKVRLDFPDHPPLHSTTLEPMEVRSIGCADGTLGLSVLTKLHMYISRKEGLLYLTGANAH